MTGRKSIIIFTFLSLIIFPFSKVVAQENPPIPVKVEVRNAQGLHFGTFTVGDGGGNVIITPAGNRIADRGIQLLNMGASPHYAIFDVYAIPGTLLQIDPISDVQLSCSSQDPKTSCSGSNVTLRIDPFLDISTGQTFITKTNPQEIIVGGKLIIPNKASGPAGNYSADFKLTIIHE